jgi:hypothetical protein
MVIPSVGLRRLAALICLAGLGTLAIGLRGHDGTRAEAPTTAPIAETPATESYLKISKSPECAGLAKPVTLALRNVALQKVVDQLREQTGADIILDNFTLMGVMGLVPECYTVTVHLENVELRRALRLLLAPHHLDYVVVENSILITTESMAAWRHLHQRICVDAQALALAKTLQQLASATNANIVLDVNTSVASETPVTLHLEDVDLETAVRLIAELSGLKAVRVEKILFVTSRERADRLEHANPKANSFGPYRMPNPPPWGMGPPPMAVPAPGYAPSPLSPFTEGPPAKIGGESPVPAPEPLPPPKKERDED